MINRVNMWQWLFLALVFVLPFQTLFQIRIANTAIQFSDLILPILGLAWLFDRSAKFTWNRFYSLLALFSVAVMLSAFFSTDPETSRIKLLGKFALVGIAFFGFNFVRSTERLRTLTRVWTASSAVVVSCCVAGIFAFYLGFRNPETNVVLHPIFGSLPAGNYPRVEGFFIFPAILCNYLSVSWWIGLIGLSAGWLKRGITLVFLPLALIASFFTFTPGIGGLFLSNGIFIRQKLSTKAPLFASLALTIGIFASAVVLSAGLVTMFSSESGRLRIPVLEGEIAPSHRVAAWTSAIETFRKYPIFGIGIGVPTASAVYTDANGNRHLLADAHNTYINVLAESGVVGFAAFMSIVLWVTWRVYRSERDDLAHAIIKLCLGLALLDAFFYQSLTGSYEDQRHIWLLLGVAAGFGSGGSKKDLTSDK